MKHALLGLALALLPGCSKTATGAGAPAHTPEELVRQMNAATDALMASPEHQDARVRIQHILVAVSGSGVAGANKSPGEAETLAAELYARALAGEDFDLLVKNHTNDSHPGIYVLVTSGGDMRTTWDRAAMVAAFGDVGWRLAPGQIGVARYDGGVPGAEPKSPFGYHVIKRLE